MKISKILLTSVCAVTLAFGAYATGEKNVTARSYVDRGLASKQNKYRHPDRTITQFPVIRL